ELNDYLGAGFNFKPLGVPVSDQTYYAVVRNGDCVSDVSTATLRVIEKPKFILSSYDTLICKADKAHTIHALAFEPNYHADASIHGYVQWNFGKISHQGDSFTPDTALLYAGFTSKTTIKTNNL